MKTYTVPDHGFRPGDRYEDPETGKLYIVVSVFSPAVFRVRPMSDSENLRLKLVRIGAWVCGALVAVLVIGVLSLVLCSGAKAQERKDYIFVLIYLTPESKLTDIGVNRTLGLTKASCSTLAKKFTMNQPDPDGNIPVAAACIEARPAPKVEQKKPTA